MCKIPQLREHDVVLFGVWRRRREEERFVVVTQQLTLQQIGISIV
jgi:hypothetical protein